MGCGFCVCVCVCLCACVCVCVCVRGGSRVISIVYNTPFILCMHIVYFMIRYWRAVFQLHST